MTNVGIQVKQISKHYRHKDALKGVSLNFAPGKIYGLLGRNGAGKSTLLNIIANRIFPSSGDITFDGVTLNNNDQALGQCYLMSEVNLYPDGDRLERLFKNTELFYGSFDYDYAHRLARKFELDLHQKFGKLSTGYRSIFKLIVALASPARYLFFDEPVLGLDANHRELFYRELVDNYGKTNRTFVISTHLIEEIAAMVEHVFIIKSGELIVDDEVEHLLSQGYLITGTKADVQVYCQGMKVLGHENLGSLYGCYVLLGDDTLPTPPANITTERLDLQRLFVQLTNIDEEELDA